MTTQLPLPSLNKANAEWLLRVLSLSQDCRLSSLEAACRYHDEVIETTRAERERLKQQPDSAMGVYAPVELSTRLAMASMGGLFTIASPLFAAQSAFVKGMQQSFQDWLKAATPRSSSQP